MDNAYFMYAAMCLFLISYIPFIIVEYRQRNTYVLYIRNIPDRIIICSGLILAMTYNIQTNNKTLIICNLPQLCLEISVLLTKFWYCVIIHNCLSSKTDHYPQVEELHTSDSYVDNKKIEIIVDIVSPLFEQK
jgi:hypothetical protein